MTQEPHPDTLLNNRATKQITRGGTQAADDKAMDAYWRALDSGMDKEEAGKVFSNVYISCICKRNSTSNSRAVRMESK